MSIFVVDTCVVRELLFHFRRGIPVFDAMWCKLEEMIENGEVVFVRETFRELDCQTKENSLEKQWINKYKSKFLIPSNDECSIVTEIYKNRNFQNNVSKKNVLEGRPVADAFVVAKAKIIGEEAVVITKEKSTDNAAKVPNLCNSLGVKCSDDFQFQQILLSKKEI